MGDCLEARLNAIENIQEEFGYDIWKVKEHLARLTSLFEDYIRTQAVHPQGPSSNQQVSRPFIRPTSHLSRGTNRPNLRQPVPPASSASRATSRHVDQPSDSMGKPNSQKIDKDKPRWDPIPISYTELFPKLVRIGHIEPVHLAPLRPPFQDSTMPPLDATTTTGIQVIPRRIAPNSNIAGQEHGVLKEDLDGKLTFEDLDGPAEVKDPSRAKVEIAGQEHGVLKEASPEKIVIQEMRYPLLRPEEMGQVAR